jgi:hypothetical protein
MRRFLILKNGRYESVPEAEFQAKQAKAIQPPAPRGLGDIVAAIATPIARALGLPCIDPQTSELRPESPCAQRKAALNRFGQDLAGISKLPPS